MLPGGCFFAGAVLEMGTRPGSVRDAVAAFQDRLTALVHSSAVEANTGGELDADEEPDQLVLEVNGLLLGAHASFVLTDDPRVLALTAQVVRRRLGVHAG